MFLGRRSEQKLIAALAFGAPAPFRGEVHGADRSRQANAAPGRQGGISRHVLDVLNPVLRSDEELKSIHDPAFEQMVDAFERPVGVNAVNADDLAGHLQAAVATQLRHR